MIHVNFHESMNNIRLAIYSQLSIVALLISYYFI